MTHPIASSTYHTTGRWRLLYFDAPTRGEQIRLLFKVADVDFDDVRLEYPKGLDPYKKATMGDASPLLGTDKCPAVTSPEGEHCVETSDIMGFVGRRVGLAPKSEDGDKRAAGITLVAQGVLNKVFYAVLMPMIAKNIIDNELLGAFRCLDRLLTRGKLERATTALEEIIAELEEEMEGNGGGEYFCGNDLTYADVAVFCVLDQVFSLECFEQAEMLRSRPKVSSFMETMTPKANDWFAERVQKFQGGNPDFVDYLAASFSPFAWTRRKKRN